MSESEGDAGGRPAVDVDSILARGRSTPELDADVLAGAAAIDSLLAYNVADSLLEQRYQVGREDRELTVQEGESLIGILMREGVSQRAAYNMVAALEEVWDPRRLQIGHHITVSLDHQGIDNSFLAFEIQPDVDRTVQVRLQQDGYLAEEIPNQLERRAFSAQGIVTSSLYQAFRAEGVRDAVLMDVIRRYSYSVDFQRDIRDGDQFQVLFDEEYQADGSYARSGNILFARLVLGSRDMPLYRFEDQDGFVDYYNPEGVSGQRLLMRTPIDGARISSNFGARRHPVLGYTRMHRGVDFAAVTGTPIYAAGAGTIDFLGTRNGYGRYVRLRHNSQLYTAYAHMSRYGEGLSAGDRVTQGQIIGYVGSSGLSTGPHLHYEVLVDGEQVNPLSVDLPTGRTLEGEDLRRFQAQMATLNTRFSELLIEPQVAEAPSN